MGLGGNLIWTTVFNAHNKRFGTGDIAVACDTPMLSDVLAGRLWRLDRDYREDIVFKHNSNIAHVSKRNKYKVLEALDIVFEKLISIDQLRRRWEAFVFRMSEEGWRRGKHPRFMHIDMRIHSYAKAQTASKTIWKEGGCAAHVIARNFGLEVCKPRSFMNFLPSEEDEIIRLLDDYSIRSPFIVVEPDTNRDWFGDLRAWPAERWQKLVDDLAETYPDVSIVQTGVSGEVSLSNVVDMVGKTGFRQACLMIKKASLFIGTEGGLMHAASAVDAPSVILWGGITLPEFAGYPHQHNVICHYVDCAPCGNLGWCDNGHKCMNLIEPDAVYEAASVLLESKTAGVK
ncbi:glycosyltransferase family 9 protein [Thalassospira sp. HF15]|uniref:glycosyltransferase family 9 protein n=1 Tax=Thalassospira sp. HF15 TaxID=2722755 RepID=UPI001430A983|nr:glycosyltransferase family 9 protein [Thalassospira sp. HF15]NIY75446.1 glycosyltransferase family 9 protein [Thalassospira sp. HF15]